MGIVTSISDIGSGRVTWHTDIAPMLGPPAGSLAGTFDAWLRLVHPDEARAARDRCTACLKGQRPVYRAEEQLLLAVDNALNQIVAKDLLAVVAGANVTLAHNGSLRSAAAVGDATLIAIAHPLVSSGCMVGGRQLAAMNASAEDAGRVAPC